MNKQTKMVSMNNMLMPNLSANQISCYIEAMLPNYKKNN